MAEQARQTKGVEVHILGEKYVVDADLGLVTEAASDLERKIQELATTYRLPTSRATVYAGLFFALALLESKAGTAPPPNAEDLRQDLEDLQRTMDSANRVSEEVREKVLEQARILDAANKLSAAAPTHRWAAMVGPPNTAP